LRVPRRHISFSDRQCHCVGERELLLRGMTAFPASDRLRSATRRRQHSLRGAARPRYMSTPVCAGWAARMTPATSPSEISRTLAPALRHFATSSAWRGRSRTQTVMSLSATFLARASAAMFSAGSLSSRRALRVAGTDRDLVHVDVWRAKQRTRLPWRSPICAGHILGAERRAFERRDGQIEARALPAPTSSPTNKTEERRDRLPDDHASPIGRRCNSACIECAAARSAAISSPRPRSRAAATAARSVTRARASARKRSIDFSSTIGVSAKPVLPAVGP